MISKLKNNVLFKSLLILWVLFFIGFSYIQYSNMHTHIYNGRVIVHSHITDNQSNLPQTDNNSANHNHSNEEFALYFSTGLLFATILLVVALLVFSLRKTQKLYQTDNLISLDFICSYFSLRAPPAL